MFAVPIPTTIEGLFAKLLVILGGLYMLAIPPQSVKKHFDHTPTPKQSYLAVAQKLGKLMLRKVYIKSMEMILWINTGFILLNTMTLLWIYVKHLTSN